MILIVGLGNPGKQFEKTRHNLGFRIVDEFSGKYDFPDFKLSKKFNALISESILNSKKVILVKPRTFMNESGKAVKKLIKNLKADLRGVPRSARSREIKNLIVIHDDLDLPLGKMKIVKNRGSAGHKGVQSIIDELRTKKFIRFRIGIQPTAYDLQPTILENFVLKKFTKKEEKNLKETTEKACRALEMAAREGIEKAMAEFNK